MLPREPTHETDNVFRARKSRLTERGNTSACTRCWHAVDLHNFWGTVWKPIEQPPKLTTENWTDQNLRRRKQQNGLPTFYNFCPKTVNWAKLAADERFKTTPGAAQATNFAIKSKWKRQINKLIEAKLTTSLKQAEYYADKVQLCRTMKSHAIC